MFLGALGAGLVIFARDGLDWSRCFVAALCLTLAVWAKQSLAPIFIAVALVTALHHGARETFRLVLASAVVGGIVSAILVGWLGFTNLRDNMFANPDRLVAFIRNLGPAARVRPDMKVVFFDDWEDPNARLRGTAAILRSLVELAQPAKAA